MHLEFLPPPPKGDLRDYLKTLSGQLQQLANTVEQLSRQIDQKEDTPYGK